MILAVIKGVGAFTAAALFAVPACADVLEIGTDGEARWIARPVLTHALESADLATLSDVPIEVSVVPETAIALANTHAQSVPSAYAGKVAELSARFDISPALIEALVWQESRWRESALSPVGARGLAQLMPGTARDLGVDANDPLANLEGGARYLREQLDRFDGDLEKALAAYNAGPGRVQAAGGIPRIRETQNYVTAIIGRLSDHSRSPN